MSGTRGAAKGALGALRERVRRADDADAVRSALAEFQRALSGELSWEEEEKAYQTVARHAAHLDEALIRQIQEQGQGAPLLKNSAVRPEHLALSASLLVEELKGYTRGRVSPGVSERALEICILLEGLAQAGALAYHSPEGQWLAQMSAGGRSAPFFAVTAAYRALLATPDVPSEVLGEMAKTAPEVLERAILAHPNASTSVYRWFLGRNWNDADFTRLAETPGARRDPEIRSALYAFGRFRSPAAFALLAPEIPPAEFATYLEHLREGDARLAAQVLREATVEQRATLKNRDLTPFLESEVAEVRLAGIAASGGVESLSAARGW